MTNRLDHLSPPAQAFLNTVRARLDDLTTSDQADLLEQVERRLYDLDTGGDPDAIDTHLGKPADLADEIRAAVSYTQALGGRDDTAMIHPSLTWILIPLAAVVASVALGLTTAGLPRTARVLVAALNVIAIALFLGYPTWWLAPAFAYYTGLVT